MLFAFVQLDFKFLKLRFFFNINVFIIFYTFCLYKGNFKLSVYRLGGMHASSRETTGTSNMNTTTPFPIFLIFYFGGANSFSVYILDFLSISWYKFTSIGAHVTFYSGNINWYMD